MKITALRFRTNFTWTNDFNNRFQLKDIQWNVNHVIKMPAAVNIFIVTHYLVEHVHMLKSSPRAWRDIYVQPWENKAYYVC